MKNHTKNIPALVTVVMLITFISAIWYTKNTLNDEFEKAEEKASTMSAKATASEIESYLKGVETANLT